MSLKASADAEASRAVEFIGAPLLCYGLLLRDQARQLFWYNRAHRAFAAAIACAGDLKTIAFVGVTGEGEMYLHTSYGHDDSIKEVRSFEGAFRGAPPPTKEILCISRLLRSEMRARIASSLVQDQKLISVVSQLPEYVETFYCRAIDDTRTQSQSLTYSLTWDEPNKPFFTTTDKEN